eukprot:TRINITY_DN532_c0_g1_i3.p1 TRINITY_DN532_c0_g1~~TRINITY_DN532_c0_g1_i3.p1  ORF type:complete len:331 (+),score=23.03 TRINITY_DN532_c0_g1_i3:37-1029(+)
MITLTLILALLFSIVTSNPCDIYALGGTPCACAHSTVRALFNSYNGYLYQVQRQSDRATKNIGLLVTGGHANSTEQDEFCRGTNCFIVIIYDQTGHGNDLTVGTPGGANPRGNTPADATAESIYIRRNKVYSVYIKPGEGYFHDGARSGIATGSEPEGIYMVTSGTHVNGGCCFDYGNAEANRRDNGAAHMDAIYFGTSCWFGGCEGTGPWVQADLENGLFSGGSHRWNTNQRAFPDRFVTAMSKNDGYKTFALKGGNAQSGGLYTLYDGPLPEGYSPMKKEGGIILGTGGDDSSWSAGTFYEGAMVRGYPSDTTENAVHENIVAAGYGF